MANNPLNLIAPTLSLCMIVRNEENLLPRCLDSAKDIVDEIVIVDTGSTDRTISIAQKYGARIFIHPWENDFSKHRNQSISYGTGDWILYLDADEELIPPGGQIIREAIKDNTIDSIAVQIINPFNNGKNQAVFNSVRVFRNHIRFEGIVHNKEIGCTQTRFYPIRILHHGYNLNVEKMKAKFDRTTILLKRQISESPDNPLPHHYLSASYLSMAALDEQYLQLAVDESTVAIRLANEQQNHEHVYLCSHYIAAAGHLNLGNTLETEAICKEALGIFADHLDSYYLLAKVYDRLEDYQSSKRSAKRYLEIRDEMILNPGKFGRIVNNSFWGEWLIKIILGKALYETGKKERTHKMFKEAIQDSQGNAQANRMVGEFYLRKAAFYEAIAYLKEATKIEKDKITLYMLMESYGQLWDVDNQVAVISDIIASFPEEVDNVNRIGLVQYERLNYPLASFCLEKAIEMGIRTPETMTKWEHSKTMLKNMMRLKERPFQDSPTISACLIVKNEEEFMEGCLKSVKPFVDEIIVVDTGSTDKSVEIAQRFGAKIYHHPWEGDFSKHRNQSMSYARGDWILMIDADEVLEKESAKHLKEILCRTSKNALLIKEINCTMTGEIRSIFGFPRIFRNFMGCHYRGIVHNQPYFPGKAEPTPVTFIHYGYSQHPEKMTRKRKRTMALLEKQIEHEPNALFPRFNLAISRFGAEDYAGAIEQGLIAIERIKKYNIHDPGYGTIYYITGMAYFYQGQCDLAERTALEGISYYPENLDAHFVLTLVYDHQKDYGKTIKYGERFLKLHKKILESNVILNIEYRTMGGAWNIMLALSLAYFRLGHPVPARQYFEEACNIAPLDDLPLRERDEFARQIGYHLTAINV